MYPAVVVLFALLTKWGNAYRPPKSETHLAVDLTQTFRNGMVQFPGLKSFQIKQLFVDIQGLNVQLEEYSSSTHIGTNINLPCAFRFGETYVDEIPLSKLIAPAAVIDITRQAAMNRDYELTIEDLLRWEEKTGLLLNDVILLVRSGWSQYWCNATAYLGNGENDVTNLHYPGVAPSAALWLGKYRNIYGIGTEAVSIDYGPAQGFPATANFLRNNVYVVESVADMSHLPPYGATVYVMPMKIEGACGSPTRVVATFPQKKNEFLLEVWPL